MVKLMDAWRHIFTYVYIGTDTYMGMDMDTYMDIDTHMDMDRDKRGPSLTVTF